MATFFDLLGHFELILEQLRPTWRYLGGILAQLTDFATIWDGTREPQSLIFQWFFNVFSFSAFSRLCPRLLRFWGDLGTILGHLGPSWDDLGAILGHLGAILGPTWAILGPTWAILGPSCANLGPSCGHLEPYGAILGHLGAILGQFGAILGPSWAILGQS